MLYYNLTAHNEQVQGSDSFSITPGHFMGGGGALAVPGLPEVR